MARTTKLLIIEVSDSVVEITETPSIPLDIVLIDWDDVEAGLRSPDPHCRGWTRHHLQEIRASLQNYAGLRTADHLVATIDVMLAEESPPDTAS